MTGSPCERSDATGPRILVCDDTPAKRYVLSSWLRRSGFDVVESATAAGALELLRSEVVDLAVLDVHLPDGSGLDVTRALRADPARAATPVIHVSAVARETSDKVAALDEGADAYLVDPIEPDELLSTVRTLLRSSGARRDAERQATRLGRLNRAAIRLNGAGSTARLAQTAARAAAEVYDVPSVALLLDERGATCRVGAGGRHQTGLPGPVPVEGVPVEEVRALLDHLGAGATRLDTDPTWAAQLPAGAWTGCAVVVDGSVEGVVAVAVNDVDDLGVPLLERLTQAVGTALGNLRALAFEHHVALTLQRSLLPGVLPEPAGLQVAARYRASQQGVEVGGDFFDVFEVDGRCFLVIGDVQGHSLEAAVVMAELRYSLRAYAFDGHDLTAIVDRLDTLLVRGGSDLIATASIIVLDRERRHLEAVSAGHHDALLVRAGAAVPVLARGLLLGTQVSDDRATLVRDVAPGDRLVMYTDGLVERRGQSLDLMVRRLVTQATTATGTAEDLADALLSTGGSSEDDVALLVVDVVG